MNTDLLTFFSPRESRGGVIQVFTVQVEKMADIEILVYSPEKVDLSRPAVVSVASDKEYQALVKEIKNLLPPGGGILAQLQSHNGFTRTALTIFKGPNFKPPQKMLRLSPAGPPRFENIPEAVDVPMGDHLVVPATDEAEKRLAAFYDELKGFPADLASAILNVIRRPSLEWRIERIERALNRPAATWKEEQRSRARSGTFLEKLLRIAMRPIPVGPAIAAALLLTAGSLAAYDKLFTAPDAASQETGKKEEKIEDKNEGKPPDLDSEESGSNETTEEDTDITNLENSEKGFSDALQGSQNSAIKKLYQTYFKDQPESFWGMAKLQALQLELMREDDPLLGDATIPGAGKLRDLYQKNKGTLEAHQPALLLLAWSHCQQDEKAQFPKTSSELRNSLPLKPDLPCTDLNPEVVQPSLDALTEWVKDQD